MSVEVSPPFILVAPPRADIPAIGRRRHAPPPPPATSRVDAALNRVVASRVLWLSPVLLLQAILCFRLSNGLEEDEAMSINAGHQMIAHLLHGTPTPAFGGYFAGVPALYAVPAAMLDHLGGPGLVRGVNTLLVLAATVLVYLACRRLFGQGAAILRQRGRTRSAAARAGRLGGVAGHPAGAVPVAGGCGARHRSR
jgi:hypothetical protein